MSTEDLLDIPRGWEQIQLNRLHGVLMIIGAPDTGKSTFARYLFRRLCLQFDRVAFLDGDPGQSRLGPPATVTMRLNQEGSAAFPPTGLQRRYFVGAVSPRDHMLPLVVGVTRLAEAARRFGAQAIVYDTSGLVNPAQGGTALKLAKIDLLQPRVVFAFQNERELEPLLIPLRRSRRVRVTDLPTSPARQPRDRDARQSYRAAQFAAYFADAQLRTFDWARRAVLPSPRFRPQQLAALEDGRGFTLGLGIVQSFDIPARQVTLLTPLDTFSGVDALRLGDLLVDPQTFRDRPAGLSLFNTAVG